MVNGTFSLSTTTYDCPYLKGFVWRKTNFSEETLGPLVATTVISLITVLPTILLNAMVIFVVATRCRLQTNSNILLACLAVTDLMTGVVLHPILIAVELKRIFGVAPFCTLEKLFAICCSLFFSSSITHLMLISVDRYIAIKHPLRYQEIVTKKWMIIGVVLAWIIPLLCTIQEIFLAVADTGTKMFMAYLNARHLVRNIIYVMSIAIMIYINVYIFSESRRQKKRIKSVQIQLEEAKGIKKNQKAANTLAIVLSALLMTFLPTVVVVAFGIRRSSGITPDNVKEISAKKVVLAWCSALFVLLGSLFNPIIYSWRSRKLRRAFLEVLRFQQPENRWSE